MNADPTWIVLIRDVSHVVRIDGEIHVVASMVLDQQTGLVRGASVGRTPASACADAMHMALTVAVKDLAALAPRQVLCDPRIICTVRDELVRLLGDGTEPAVVETSHVAEAEDIFDSFVGHMAGRSQPQEFATPNDWLVLIQHAHRYMQVQPWLRWADDDHLDLVVRVDNTAARYVAVVMGQSGIQRGLVLYPGGVFPTGMLDGVPGLKVTVPNGTVLFYLDPPEQTPPEFIAKARRYGWPEDADLFPVWLVGGPDRPADPDRVTVQRLTVALAAVIAHHTKPDGATTENTIDLADGRHGAYTIRQTPQR